jgi:hypothetical protein
LVFFLPGLLLPFRLFIHSAIFLWIELVTGGLVYVVLPIVLTVLPKTRRLGVGMLIGVAAIALVYLIVMVGMTIHPGDG